MVRSSAAACFAATLLLGPAAAPALDDTVPEVLQRRLADPVGQTAEATRAGMRLRDLQYCAARGMRELEAYRTLDEPTMGDGLALLFPAPYAGDSGLIRNAIHGFILRGAQGGGPDAAACAALIEDTRATYGPGAVPAD